MIYGFGIILTVVILIFASIIYMNEKWQLTGIVKDFMNQHIEGNMDFDSLQSVFK